MKYCPKCKNTIGENYCYKDGSKLIEYLKCENCGKELALQDKFCENCGKEVKIV